MQIVSGLSPPLNGIGDYALGLARQLKADFATDSIFVVAGMNAASAVDRGFAALPLRERSSTGLVRALEEAAGSASFQGEPQTVLVHMSPYGYDSGGFPLWLSAGMRRWSRAQTSRRRVITIFHELDAFGPPWTRAFWISPLQRMVTRGVLDSTHVAIATLGANARKLKAWASPKSLSITCLAIPSSVGEPAAIPPIAVRKRRICLFGIRAGANLPPYAAGLLATLVRGWAIEEIAVVGGSPAVQPFENIGCRVVAYPGLSAEPIGALLSDSILGMSWYPPAPIAKSSVYAAYCAHGVPTVVLGRSRDDPSSHDGLERGKHYLLPSELSSQWSPDLLQRISDRAFEWYQGHRICAHARAVAGGLSASRQSDR